MTNINNNESESVGWASPGTGTLLGCIKVINGDYGNVEGGTTVGVGDMGGGYRNFHRNRNMGTGYLTPCIISVTMAAAPITVGTKIWNVSSSIPNVFVPSKVCLPKSSGLVLTTSKI